VAKAYDMLPEDAGQRGTGPTAADNADTSLGVRHRSDKKSRRLDLSHEHGRNFDEVLRPPGFLPAHREAKVATPVNWKRERRDYRAGGLGTSTPSSLPGGWKARSRTSGSFPSPR